MKRDGRWYAWAFLAAVALAVYANTLSNGFVNDDEHLVLLNPWLTAPGSIPAILSGSFWGFAESATVNDYYRPLVHLIYRATCQLFGYQAWAFHLVNALFHAANTILVFLVASRLPGSASEPGAGARGLKGAPFLSVPFVAALLFAVHPVHTEAVAWIAALPELSFTFLCLISFYLYAVPGRMSGTRLSASVALFFLALLCKETALTLLATMAVYDLTWRRKGRSTGEWVAAYTPYLLAAGAYLIIRYQVLSGTLVSAAPGWRPAPSVAAISIFPLFREYLQVLLLPVPLAYWRPFHPISSLLTMEGISGLAAAAAFLGAAALAWKKSRPAFLALSFIAIPLAPVFYIAAFPRTPLAERYLYLPSVGLVLLLALGLRALLAVPGLRISSTVVLVSLVFAGSAATVLRNRVWKDAHSLFFDSVRKSPDTPLPPVNLAATLLQRGRVDEALAQYRILAEARPENADYRASLGSALVLKGRLDEGIEQLRTALALKPESRETLNDLAMALRRKGPGREAEALYRKALEIDPDYAEAHLNLGNTLAESGRMDEAMEHYQAAVRLRPDHAYFRAVLGIEYAKQGQLDEAIEHFSEAVRLAPGEPAHRRNLDRALALKDSTDSSGRD